MMEVELPQPELEGYTFKMDEKTFNEIKGTITNLISSGGTETLGRLTGDEYNVSQLTAVPKEQEVPTAPMEAEPATVSVELPRTFVDTTEFNNHVDLHNNMRASLYLCGICSMRFPNRESITEHVNSCHERIRLFSCRQCRRTFNTMRSLKKHKESRHTVRYSRNGAPFDTRLYHRIMNLHMGIGNARIERRDVLTTPNRPEERSRTNAAHGNRYRSRSAGTSNTGTRNAGNANVGTRNVETRHASSHNGGSRNGPVEAEPATVSVECHAGATDMPPPSKRGRNDPYECIECPRTFVDFADFNHHLGLHNKMRESQYICDICSRSFRNSDCITVHLESCHATCTSNKFEKVNPGTVEIMNVDMD